jgi:hypothetical protein
MSAGNNFLSLSTPLTKKVGEFCKVHMPNETSHKLTIKQ